jgi:hypothetical protein
MKRTAAESRAEAAQRSSDDSVEQATCYSRRRLPARSGIFGPTPLNASLDPVKIRGIGRCLTDEYMTNILV